MLMHNLMAVAPSTRPVHYNLPPLSIRWLSYLNLMSEAEAAAQSS
ncbi:MAG: hypothetical protein A4E45_02264 [Methanosaeta sp. PtaB.Bin039]|nr:MAG: hypothetical protein A4E45_02264 [Methanosaeta sp. PtaB.Bin039]